MSARGPRSLSSIEHVDLLFAALSEQSHRKGTKKKALQDLESSKKCNYHYQHILFYFIFLELVKECDTL